MESKYNNNEERVDILSLHTELGGVELVTCAPGGTLEFQALLTDPAFTRVICFQLAGIECAGRFLDVMYQGRIFTLHESVIPKLYRIENFAIKRTYYYSDSNPAKASTTQTFGGIDHYALQTPAGSQQGASGQDVQEDGISSRTAAVGECHALWSDMEEDIGRKTFNQDILQPTTGTRKPVTIPKFHQDKFLDELPALGQAMVTYRDFVLRNESFERRDFYLFDFVACFTDIRNVFKREEHFKFSSFKKILDKLNEISRSKMALSPLQADSDNWSPMMRFLCQTMSGEHQISFLRVALFFSVRKVVNKTKILNSQIDGELKSFFTGDDPIRNDGSRVIRLNLSALRNNQKVLIDKYYAENCITPVFTDEVF